MRLLLCGLLISCSPVQRLTEDDIDIAKNKALIEDKSLSRTHLTSPASVPSLPASRRELLSVLHHPYSFSDLSFLSSLSKRVTPDFISPQAEIASTAPEDSWPKAYLEEFEKMDFLLLEAIEDFSQQKAETLRLLSQNSLSFQPPQKKITQAELSHKHAQTQLHLHARQLSLSEVITMLERATDTVISLRTYTPEYDEKIHLNMKASAGVILHHIAAQFGLVVASEGNNQNVYILLKEDDFQALQRQYLLTTQWEQQKSAIDESLASLSKALEILHHARQNLALLITSTTRASRNVASIIFDTPAPSILNDTFINIQKLSEQIEAKTKRIQLHIEKNHHAFQTNTHDASALSAYFSDKLSADPCVDIGDEIFIEDIRLFHQEPKIIADHLNQLLKLSKIPDNAEQAESEILPAPSDQAQTCQNPLGTARLTINPQPSSLLISGGSHGVELVAQMIERLDTPRLQVLVEIFMVTVSRGFNRQLENILTSATDPGAGGNNIAEAELLRSISSAVTGGYTVNLATATGQIQSAFSFLETHQLGRVLSSPTILVQDGTEEARIRRQTTAEVLFAQNIFDNSSRVIDTEDINTQLKAPLELLLRDIRVFPAYQTVQMKVEITNKEFVLPLDSINRQEDADFTEDLIQTEFTASPGDVIVLAGLTNNKDSTSTVGIPGTTTLPGGFAGLLGGSDSQNNQTHEMVVFLVPTVINPANTTHQAPHP